jgi:hypothetical protein
VIQASEIHSIEASRGDLAQVRSSAVADLDLDLSQMMDAMSVRYLQKELIQASEIHSIDASREDLRQVRSSAVTDLYLDLP